MATSTVEFMNRGMKCLTDQMGIVEAEQFISTIIRESALRVKAVYCDIGV